MRVLRFVENRGQSAALDAGFRAARGAVIAMIDADLQNDPADLPRLLAALDRADVVNGIRVGRRDPWLRRISSRVANAFRNWATQDHVTDVGCSLRVMRAGFVRRVKLYRGMHRFLPTLLRMEGARVIEVPVNHRPRRRGRSKYGIANRLRVALGDLLAVRWMQRRRLDYRLRGDDDR
jgi:glycosyltransferase involved in cell wall biosynthesis